MPLLPATIIDSLGPIVAYIQDDHERLGLIVQYLSSTLQPSGVDSIEAPISDSAFFSFDNTENHSTSDSTEIDTEGVSDTEADSNDSWGGIPDSPIDSPVRRKRPRPVVSDSEDVTNIPDFKSFDVVPSGALPGVNSRGGKCLSKQVSKGLWINGRISINGIVASTKDRFERCDRCVRMKEAKCLVLRSVEGDNLPFMSASCGNCVRAGQSCKDSE